MKFSNFVAAFVFALTVCFPIASSAVETVTEKVQTGTNKAVDYTKEAGRDASDQICEMVNGKMKCIAKKLKHRAHNMSDDAATKAEELKNKVD